MLAQYQHHLQIKQVLNNIRNAPDFALLSHDRTRVFLVEVKYRREPAKDEILTIAKDTLTVEPLLPPRRPAGLLLLLVQDDR